MLLFKRFDFKICLREGKFNGPFEKLAAEKKKVLERFLYDLERKTREQNRNN